MHIIKIVLSLFILVVIFAPSNLVAEHGPLRIGVITTLSGGMATIGTAVRNGIELARQDRPELFRKLQFHYEDDQLSARNTITAYNNLRSQHGVDLLFVFGTVQAQAIGPLIERDQIPMINFNFEAQPAVGKQFIVRAMNHTDQYMLALADVLKTKRESVFPIVQSEITFFEAMGHSLQNALGGETKLQLVAAVKPDSHDFRSTILKLRAFREKPVGLFLLPEQLISFLRQAHDLDFKALYFGTDLCETAASLAEIEGLLDGCLYPDNSVSEEFRSRYRARYGDEAQLTFAGSAYDMTILVGELLRSNQKFNPQNFLKALSAVQSHAGVLGDFTFRDNKESGKFFEYPVYVKRIVGKLGVPLQR